jgi:hypothetical protein
MFIFSEKLRIGRWRWCFYGKLYETWRHVGGVDRICWIPSKRMFFEVRSFFGVLSISSDRYEGGCSSFPWKGIWKVKVPLRVSFFVWTASLGKILTLDNLRKRGLIVVNWCCMCKRSGESINHLLLHCEVARTLWSVLFTLFSVKWVMNDRVLDLLVCWKGQRGNKMVMEVWRMAPLCLMWTIWKERNARCFEDMELTMAELSNRFLKLLFLWAGVLNIPQVSNMQQFVQVCSSFYL